MLKLLVLLYSITMKQYKRSECSFSVVNFVPPKTCDPSLYFNCLQSSFRCLFV